MKYFPIYIDLERQPVLVVGGGEQAAQKIRLLAKTNALITVVTETLVPELEDCAADGRIRVERRRFRPGDVADRRLVYAATGEDETDQAVAEAARARNLPVNVVDRPDACSFITPAIVDRDPVTVAIGTEGAAPVLAREIKTRLERDLPAGLGRVAERARSLRGRVAREIGDGRRRRRLWERLLRGRFRERVLAGDEAGAALAVETEIGALGQGVEDAGRVTLVGCGPGDPDLLTLRAQQRLQDADVLVVDRLVNPRILEFARRDAERIFVGKTPGGPATSQDEINRILVREARAGKTVARLKGGDPLIFGRAVEELSALARAGIAAEVVPGITAAHASAASLNLPVTSRGHHRKFSVLTGATADGVLDHDWAALGRSGEAFAVYMGVRSTPEIRRRLLAAGMGPETPVVIVENATLPHERAIATSLGDLALCMIRKGVKGPAILFVGLDWADLGLVAPDKVERFSRENIVPFEQPSDASAGAAQREAVG